MDFLPDIDTLMFWLTNYGSFVLFVLLVLGIIAFPVPEETIMVLAGILIRNGTLIPHPTLFAIYAGSIFGITTSYLLGRTAGTYFIRRYGGWVGITEEHLARAHRWFERFGKWSLVIGYFIPGIRHFTGFCAGMTELDFKQFALYAYSGAILWVTTFVSIGYYSGTYWLELYKHLMMQVDTYTLFLIGLVIAAVLLFLMFRKRNKGSKQQDS
jgi:membrane protein DedA with SNARE-associated domain